MKRWVIAAVVGVMSTPPAAAIRRCPRMISQDTLMSTEQVITQIRSVFGAASDTAVAIAKRESHLLTGAVNENCNGTRDYGLFQLNSGGTLQTLGLTRASALDPFANINAAYELYQQRGWRPW